MSFCEAQCDSTSSPSSDIKLRNSVVVGWIGCPHFVGQKHTFHMF